MRKVCTANGVVVLIAPIAGHGKHVFRKEAARLAALYDIEPEHIILFDQNAPSKKRFAFVNAELRRIAQSLPTGWVIQTVIVLRHGYPLGGQEGVWTSNVHEQVAACGGRLARNCNWIFLSCSNAATIGKHPNGDMSLADAMRDALCRAGYVDCQVYGHLIAGHATLLIADRAGGTWRPLARYFRGEGRPEGGLGGEVVLPKGHELLDDLYRLMRRSVVIDIDDDGEDDDMIGFRFLVPFFESQAEVETWIRRCADVRAELVRVQLGADAPSVADLQRALARGNFMELPSANDGLGDYGPRTKAGVISFQRAHGLTPDGIAGPLTWAELLRTGLLVAQAA